MDTQTQHYVYAELRDPTEVARAVEALVNASFEPSDIDAFGVRDGELVRLPLVHQRPWWNGTIIGVVVGAVVGWAFGATIAPDWFGHTLGPWSWALLVAGLGAISGWIGGGVFWHTNVAVQTDEAQLHRYYVGTTVTAGRRHEVHAALHHSAPLSEGEYVLSPGESFEQHAARDMLMAG